MKVILLQDHKKLGSRGDLINVADGFAFNNLIPQGIAKPATEQALAEIERQHTKEEKELEQEKEQLKTDAKKIDKKKITIQKQAKGDKLFGSVTKKDIVDVIDTEHKIKIKEENVLLDAPIKELTTQEVKIDYGHDVTGSIIVTVTAE